jgi:hypothetical protein
MQPLPPSTVIAQSEVNEFQLIIPHDNVLRLDVPMTDTASLEVKLRIEQLHEVNSCHFLRQPTQSVDFLKELLPFHEFRDDIVAFGRLVELVQLEDVGVTHLPQDLPLALHPQQVLLIDYSRLLKDLYGCVVTRGDVPGLFNLAESALADGVLQSEVRECPAHVLRVNIGL